MDVEGIGSQRPLPTFASTLLSSPLAVHPNGPSTEIVDDTLLEMQVDERWGAFFSLTFWGIINWLRTKFFGADLGSFESETPHAISHLRVLESQIKNSELKEYEKLHIILEMLSIEGIFDIQTFESVMTTALSQLSWECKEHLENLFSKQIETKNVKKILVKFMSQTFEVQELIENCLKNYCTEIFHNQTPGCPHDEVFENESGEVTFYIDEEDK